MSINTFIFMGRPGCGKGMQAKMLSQKTSFDIFSTGGKLREVAEGSTKLAKKVKEVIDSGELMPSWFVVFLYQDALLKLGEEKGIIFEGVGRKEEEAKLFAQMCEWLNRDFRVIYLDVSENTVTDRLHKRQAEEGRADDDPYKLETRFRNYDEHTLPALNYFRSIGKVIEVDGEPLPEVVFGEIWSKISSLI